jgi:hypothetical protein
MDVALIRRVAQVCHEANRAYCATLGDLSQPSWDEAPDWQVNSAKAGVAALVLNPGLEPRDSHELWCRGKRLAGWSYGPVKDPDHLRHPCLVPYGELPPEQRKKDELFLAVARALLGTPGK